MKEPRSVVAGFPFPLHRWHISDSSSREARPATRPASCAADVVGGRARCRRREGVVRRLPPPSPAISPPHAAASRIVVLPTARARSAAAAFLASARDIAVTASVGLALDVRVDGVGITPGDDNFTLARLRFVRRRRTCRSPFAQFGRRTSPATLVRHRRRPTSWTSSCRGRRHRRCPGYVTRLPLCTAESPYQSRSVVKCERLSESVDTVSTVCCYRLKGRCSRRLCLECVGRISLLLSQGEEEEERASDCADATENPPLEYFGHFGVG